MDHVLEQQWNHVLDQHRETEEEMTLEVLAQPEAHVIRLLVGFCLCTCFPVAPVLRLRLGYHPTGLPVLYRLSLPRAEESDTFSFAVSALAILHGFSLLQLLFCSFCLCTILYIVVVEVL